MIPAYQITSLVLAEHQLQEAERRKRQDHGEPGAYPSDFTRRASGSRLDLLRRALARLAAPAQRPTEA
jgi:hypothetical protein